ncbi:MAG: NUDIX domain-containing protein [archaeon]|jgi:8-oxo-dGTP pyrophosphatase MutT (NUDIX family)
MITKKSGILIFARNPLTNELEIMVAHVKGPDGKTWYDFPKGKLNPNETPQEGAVREAFEEVLHKQGYDLHLLDGFKHTTKYSAEKQRTAIKWSLGIVTPKNIAPKGAVPIAFKWGYPRDFSHETKFHPSIESEKVEFLPLSKAREVLHVDRLTAVLAAQKFLQQKGITPKSGKSRTNPAQLLYPRTRIIGGKPIQTYFFKKPRIHSKGRA